MKQKGQLFSLDFLLAIALIILGFGVILKFWQLAVFEWQERQEWIETETHGQNAVLLLLSNPQLTCELTTWNGAPLGEHVNNCLDTSNIINAETLGLPENWGYRVYNQTDGILIAGGESVPSGTKTVFSVETTAVLSNVPVPKQVLYKCLKKTDWQGNPLECGLEKKILQVSIWRP